MAIMKVFVSSTCYDLSEIRSQMRSFLVNVGFEPVMSEFSDILFHPEAHTHESCAKEVSNCDMVVVIIGGRFGGKTVPQALKAIDWDRVKKHIPKVENPKDRENFSVTQLEVLSAIESDIPIFAFVEEDVWHDHHVYEQNKHKPIIKEIEFPSIERPELAQYIFEFINMIRLRPTGNSIVHFSRFEDVSEHLKKQWSALFQRLLRDQKENDKETRRAFQFNEQLEDIKTALITSIGNTDAKKTAKAAISFRHVISFIRSLFFNGDLTFLADQQLTLRMVFDLIGVQKIYELQPDPERGMRFGIFLVLKTGEALMLRVPKSHLVRVSEDLKRFNEEKKEIRRSVIDAVYETDRTSFPLIRKFKSEAELLDSFPDKVKELTLDALLSDVTSPRDEISIKN